MIVKLREVCFSRAGDKGDVSNVGIACYKPEYYDVVKEQITAEKVKAYYEGIVKGRVDRYEIPGMDAFMFVMQEALDGGTTRSLRLDAYGKALSGYILNMDIDMPEELLAK